MCLADFEGFAPLSLWAVVAFPSVTLFFPRRRSRPWPLSVSVFQNCAESWFVKSTIRSLSVLRDAKKETEFPVWHITNGTIFLYCKIIMTVVFYKKRHFIFPLFLSKNTKTFHSSRTDGSHKRAVHASSEGLWLQLKIAHHKNLTQFSEGFRNLYGLLQKTENGISPCESIIFCYLRLNKKTY